jgi:transposase
MQQNSKVFVGLDTSKLKISVAVAEDGRQGEVRFLGEIDNTPEAVRRLVHKLASRHGELLFCYEAGPTGYGLQRQIAALGHECAVIAPSLIPKRPGERVKTNRRDALTLARLHRAGELTAIRVPSATEEAVRDLCRARADLVADRRRARQRLPALLLRHGRVYRDGRPWTQRHQGWLSRQRFDHPALQLTLAHHLAVLDSRDAELAAIEADLLGWQHREPFTDTVHRLASYRGIAELGALTLAAEVIDWRRFATGPLACGCTDLADESAQTHPPPNRSRGLPSH